jgi:hypothetical protein
MRDKNGFTSNCRLFNAVDCCSKTLYNNAYHEHQTLAIINRARNCTKRARVARARYRAFYANSRLIWHFRDFEIPLVLCGRAVRSCRGSLTPYAIICGLAKTAIANLFNYSRLRALSEIYQSHERHLRLSRDSLENNTNRASIFSARLAERDAILAPLIQFKLAILGYLLPHERSSSLKFHLS